MVVAKQKYRRLPDRYNQFFSGQELLVTGSSFGTLRLWTVMGSYIGAFGQEKNYSWEIPELVKAPSEEKIESVRKQRDVSQIIK